MPSQRIADKRKEPDFNVDNAYLSINHLHGDMTAEVKAFTDEFEFFGKPLMKFGNESLDYQVVEKMLKHFLK